MFQLFERVPDQREFITITNNKLHWYFAVGGLHQCILQFITKNNLNWYFGVGRLHPPPPQYCIFQFIPNNKLNWYFAVGVLQPPPPK
jgi:hypothetical protein